MDEYKEGERRAEKEMEVVQNREWERSKGRGMEGEELEGKEMKESVMEDFKEGGEGGKEGLRRRR